MGVVANLVVRVSANIADFEKQMAGLERSMGRTGARMKSVGSELTKGLTLPLVALGGLSIKAAMDFESSFAGVRKTVDGVVDAGGNLTAFGKDLQQKFRDLAKEIPVSVNELNRIGESAGQLGIKSESIIGFTKTIAAMGVATNLTTEQAADGMARFANITQMPQEKIENLGSTIVELGNKLAATESEILEFGLRIAGAGEIAGLTEAQILGIAGAFSSVGIEAEAGGTAVQKALLAMNSAVTTGKGLDAFGGAEFARQFNANPGAAFASFIEMVGRAGKGGEQVLRNAGFDDARQIRAFLSLASAGDLLRNSLKLAADEWVRNTALAREAEQRYRTFEFQLTGFKNRLQDVAITLGTQLIESLQRMMPSLEIVVGAFARMVEWFSRLPQPVQTATFAFFGIAAALGPVAWAIGQIMTTAGAFIGFWRTLPGVVGKAASAFSKLPPWMGGGVPGMVVGGAVAGATLAAPGQTMANEAAINAGVMVGGEGLPTVLPGGPGGGRKRTGDIELKAEASAIQAVGAASRSAAPALQAFGNAQAAAAATAAVHSARLDALLDQMERQDQLLDKSRESISEFLPRDRFGLNWQQLLLSSGQGDMSMLMNAQAPAIQNQGVSMGVSNGSGFLTGFSEMVRTELGPTILSALTGGGNVGKSIGGFLGGEVIGGFAGKLTGQLSGMFGKTIGGALGSVIPGLGTLLGSMIGPLIGKVAGKLWNGIRSVFGTDEEARDVNPARDAFLAQFGGAGTGDGSGFHNLAARLTEITGEEGGGALFRALTQADTMQEFNTAVGAIEAKLASAAAQVEDVTAANETFNMSLTGSDEAIKELGQAQLTVTEMMLKGFDRLIVKLDELIARMATATAPGPASDAGSFSDWLQDERSMGGGVTVNIGTVETADAESFLAEDLVDAVRRNEYGIRTELTNLLVPEPA